MIVWQNEGEQRSTIWMQTLMDITKECPRIGTSIQYVEGANQVDILDLTDLVNNGKIFLAQSILHYIRGFSCVHVQGHVTVYMGYRLSQAKGDLAVTWKTES